MQKTYRRCGVGAAALLTISSLQVTGLIESAQ